MRRTAWGSRGISGIVGSLGLAIVGCLALVAGGQAAAQPSLVVEVDVHPALGTSPDVRDLLRRIAKGADLDIQWVAGRRARVVVDPIGLERLFANAELASVREVSGPTAAAEVPGPAPRLIAWTIRLDAPAGAQGATGERAAGDGATARYAAGIVRRSSLEDPGLAIVSGGPGTLVVLGLDAQGNEIARGAIVDPRVVRHESLDANGHYRSRREFLRRHAQFSVVLPDDARITALEIAESGPHGGALRTLARVVVP